MTKVLFTSDLHLGHKNVGKWRGFANSCEENTAKIAEMWFSSVGKRDTVWVLGDAAFNRYGLDALKAMPGRKLLVRGNHDYLRTHEYLEVFEEVYGIESYRAKYGVRAWLSHAPIHPDELRGRVNIHGHVHYSPIELPFNPARDIKRSKDPRYINACCDYLVQETGNMFLTLDDIREAIRG